jgi:hypothetical protein
MPLLPKQSLRAKVLAALPLLRPDEDDVEVKNLSGQIKTDITDYLRTFCEAYFENLTQKVHSRDWLYIYISYTNRNDSVQERRILLNPDFTLPTTEETVHNLQMSREKVPVVVLWMRLTGKEKHFLQWSLTSELPGADFREQIATCDPEYAVSAINAFDADAREHADAAADAQISEDDAETASLGSSASTAPEIPPLPNAAAGASAADGVDAGDGAAGPDAADEAADVADVDSVFGDDVQEVVGAVNAADSDDEIPLGSDLKKALDALHQLPQARGLEPNRHAALKHDNRKALRSTSATGPDGLFEHETLPRVFETVAHCADIVMVPGWEPVRWTVVARVDLRRGDVICAVPLHEGNFKSVPAGDYPSFGIFDKGGPCQHWSAAYTIDIFRAQTGTAPHLFHAAKVIGAKEFLPTFVGYMDTYFHGSTCCLVPWPSRVVSAATHLLVKAVRAVRKGEKLTFNYGPGYVGCRSLEQLEKRLSKGKTQYDFEKATERVMRKVHLYWASLVRVSGKIRVSCGGPVAMIKRNVLGVCVVKNCFVFDKFAVSLRALQLVA